MVKVQVKCIGCGNIFWSKAKKNALGELVSDTDTCKTCENRLRHDAQVENNDEKIPSFSGPIKSTEKLGRDTILSEISNKIIMDKRKEIADEQRRKQTRI